MTRVGIDSYPDPRRFIGDGVAVFPVIVATSESGRVSVGTDLFSFNDVFVGDVRVATAQDPAGAQFVRGVFLHDPEVAEVYVPEHPDLDEVLAAWSDDCATWMTRFEGVLAEVLTGIVDARICAEIRDRSLVLLHAQ